LKREEATLVSRIKEIELQPASAAIARKRCFEEGPCFEVGETFDLELKLSHGLQRLSESSAIVATGRSNMKTSPNRSSV